MAQMTATSNTSKANYLDSVGMSVDAWVKLTPEQQEAKLKKALDGKTKDEIQEALDKIAEDIKSERDDLKELEQKLRKQLRHDSGLSASQKEEVARWLDKLDEIDAELKGIKGYAQDIATDINKHRMDVSGGEDINISENSLKLDGEPYTYRISNSQGNPFGEDAKKNPLEGVTSDGTAKGEVIRDVNGDTLMNYADIESAQQQAEMMRVTESQKIFVNTPEDYKWELASADRDKGTYTFKVTNKKGESSYVTFENAQDAVFIFKSGVSEKDLGTIQKKWPPELLKNCFWGSDEKSFAEHFDPKKKATEAERLTAISGYDELKAAFNAGFDKLNTGNPDRKDKFKSLYEKAVDDFYGILDNNKPDKASQISQKWKSLFKDWQQAGLSTDEILNLAQILITSMQAKDKAHAAVFVSSPITDIESALKGLNASGATKHQVNAFILFLELQSGSGPLGGSSALSSLETLAGSNANDKLATITALKSLYKMSGLTPPAELSDLEKGIIEHMTAEEKIQATGGYYQMTADVYERLMGSVGNYGAEYGADTTDGIYEEELAAILGAFVELIHNGGKETSVEILRRAILDNVKMQGGELRDEVAATLLQLLHDKDRALFDKLLQSKSFCDGMWGIINNGGNDPENFYQCREWLTGRDFIDAPIFDDTINGAVDLAEDWGEEVPVFGHIAGGIVGGVGGLVTDIGDGLSDAYDWATDW